MSTPPDQPVQSSLFPPPAANPAATPPAPPPAAAADEWLAPVWFQRLSLFILVLFCIYLGLIVTVLPWWTTLWDHNLFFAAHPRLWAVLQLGPVRGVISGLGILDIWIGISEAIAYRDHRPLKPESPPHAP